jgi:hypothetical protein
MKQMYFLTETGLGTDVAKNSIDVDRVNIKLFCFILNLLSHKIISKEE